MALAQPDARARSIEGLGLHWLPRPDPAALVATCAYFALLAIALFGGRFAPYEPIYFVVEHGRDPRPYDPGIVFPFGSDVLGRDLFSLVLGGARATLTIVLLAGLARVLAGILIAAVGVGWRPARVVMGSLAELVSAVPATLVALVLVRAYVKTDTSIPVVIAALLLVGWAGPFRVIRAEVERLAVSSFAEGARALGIRRWRLFWRHLLPHLVPVIAVSLSQQIVASLVLVAELGVLSVIVSPVRSISVVESLSVVRAGEPSAALVPDTAEWGAMLSSARTIEALWATRWLIFVPGVAFALTAVAVGTLGFVLARRYARRDVFADARGFTALVIGTAILAGVAVSLPERYSEAREWAAAARADLAPVSDTRAAFERAGLRTYPVARDVTTIVRSGPASVRVGQVSIAESTDATAATRHIRSVIASTTGGGIVEAPLVFAGRGLVPSELPTRPLDRRVTGPILGRLIEQHPDDYAGIDVRGKVVLLVRFLGIETADREFVVGTDPLASIRGALDRGAAAVLFVDPDLSSYRETTDPYLPPEREFPAIRAAGPPVLVLDRVAAEQLAAPIGLDLAPLLRYEPAGTTWDRSPARDLETLARVHVPVSPRTFTFTSLVGEVATSSDAGRIVIWAARPLDGGPLDASRADVLGSIAATLAERDAPFVLVEADPRADSRAVRDALADRRVSLVVVLDDLSGGTLRFVSANGDLIPAFDLYAERAGAPHEITRSTTPIEKVALPFPSVRTVTIATTGTGDARGAAAAVLGYLAGRRALGAPEVPR